MSTKIFVNLPVKDLPRSMKFFSSLGYSFNPQFTDENAACMIITEDIFAMLLVEEFFKTFTPKEIADSQKTTEVLTALFVENREKVDELVAKAVAAGGKTYRKSQDMGFMYSHGFEDLDGHIWEIGWMDPNHVQQ